MMKNLEEHGAQLIDQLKKHIENVVVTNPKPQGFSLEDIQKASGLIIVGRNGQNVWDMAVATLVIELAKEHRLRSSIPVNQLNTKFATLARFYTPMNPKQ